MRPFRRLNFDFAAHQLIPKPNLFPKPTALFPKLAQLIPKPPHYTNSEAF